MFQRLKNLSKTLLRGGYCAVWIFSFIMAFAEFLYYAESDSDTDAHRYFLRMVVAIVIGIVTSVTHSHLLHKDIRNESD